MEYEDISIELCLFLSDRYGLMKMHDLIQIGWKVTNMKSATPKITFILR